MCNQRPYDLVSSEIDRAMVGLGMIETGGNKVGDGEGEGKDGERKRLKIAWVNSAGVEERNRKVGEDGQQGMM